MHTRYIINIMQNIYMMSFEETASTFATRHTLELEV